MRSAVLNMFLAKVKIMPTNEGWYWYRLSDQHEWSVRHVYFRWGVYLHSGVDDDENTLENYPGEWIKIAEPS